MRIMKLIRCITNRVVCCQFQFRCVFAMYFLVLQVSGKPDLAHGLMNHGPLDWNDMPNSLLSDFTKIVHRRPFRLVTVTIHLLSIVWHCHCKVLAMLCDPGFSLAPPLCVCCGAVTIWQWQRGRRAHSDIVDMCRMCTYLSDNGLFIYWYICL